MSDKELFMVDCSVEIDERLLKKIDKQIREDKSIPEDEKELWDRVHLYPMTLSRKLIRLLEEKYGS